MVDGLKQVLKCESHLLTAFRKYLPYEKGFILSRTEEYLREIQKKSLETIQDHCPNFEKLIPIQRIHLLRYLAFLLAIYNYEKELKRLEYEEKDVRLAQLKDERLLNIAKALKKEVKRGRRPKKRMRLEKLKGEIIRLREEGLGADTLVKYLWKAHKLKVSKPYLLKVLRDWETKDLKNGKFENQGAEELPPPPPKQNPTLCSANCMKEF